MIGLTATPYVTFETYRDCARRPGIEVLPCAIVQYLYNLVIISASLHSTSLVMLDDVSQLLNRQIADLGRGVDVYAVAPSSRTSIHFTPVSATSLARRRRLRYTDLALSHIYALRHEQSRQDRRIRISP